MQSFALSMDEVDSAAINEPRMSRKLADGSVVVCGAVGPDNTVPFLMSVAGDGTMQWRKTYGPLSFSPNTASAFRPIPDGGFIVTGTKQQHMLLMRLGEHSSGVAPARALPVKMDLSLLGIPQFISPASSEYFCSIARR